MEDKYGKLNPSAPSTLNDNPQGYGKAKVSQKPLIDLQVYEPAKPHKKPPTTDPSMYVPITTQNPYNPGALGQQMVPYQGAYYPYNYVPNYMPVVKNYNINVGGPEADHVKVSAIYEDMLPNRGAKDAFNSISERLTTYNFIRSVLVKQKDGETISLNGETDNSILRYIKFLELNPNQGDSYNLNPYKNLPSGMLIYRSCYPIRLDTNISTILCAKDSIGINVRIYKMTEGEFNIRSISGKQYYDYDLWREIAFYEYIREQIIKKKMCPNFITMYAYYICTNCKIDFDKVDYARQLHSTTKVKPAAEPGLVNVHEDGHMITKQNPQSYTGKALIALTESPTYNLISWATKTYEQHGNVKRMISTGFHDEKVWFSIIFQIIAALYTLQIHEIAFKNFQIQDCIYIKDLKQYGNSNSYWKYKIDGIDYYVPNYGFLVMIDTNYKEIEKSDSTLITRESKTPYKLVSNIFGQYKNTKELSDVLKHNCFLAFKNVIDPNVYRGQFLTEGGSRPPDNVLSLLDKIIGNAVSSKNTDIGYYIFEHMRYYMNNRIGSYLHDSEVLYIRKDDKRDFYNGQIVVLETQYDTYKFVLFAKNLGNGSSLILTKEESNVKLPGTEDIIDSQVPTSNLFNYSRDEQIVQTTTGDVNLTEEGLIESYAIYKNK